MKCKFIWRLAYSQKISNALNINISQKKCRAYIQLTRKHYWNSVLSQYDERMCVPSLSLSLSLSLSVDVMFYRPYTLNFVVFHAGCRSNVLTLRSTRGRHAATCPRTDFRLNIASGNWWSRSRSTISSCPWLYSTLSSLWWRQVVVFFPL